MGMSALSEKKNQNQTKDQSESPPKRERVYKSKPKQKARYRRSLKRIHFSKIVDKLNATGNMIKKYRIREHRLMTSYDRLLYEIEERKIECESQPQTVEFYNETDLQRLVQIFMTEQEIRTRVNELQSLLEKEKNNNVVETDKTQ
jgi:hypothetical protein